MTSLKDSIKRHLGILLASMSVTLYVASAYSDACDDKLDCLLENPKAFTDQNKAQTWQALRDARRDALRCVPEALTSVLRSASVPHLDGSVAEWVSQSIEEVCIAQPKCMIRSLAALSPNEKLSVERLLGNPLYHEPAELAVCR